MSEPTGPAVPARSAQTLDAHVLARTAEHPSFRRIEAYSPRNVRHAFRLAEAPDADFLALLSEARLVGEQRHLGGSGDR